MLKHQFTSFTKDEHNIKGSTVMDKCVIIQAYETCFKCNNYYKTNKCTNCM